MVERISVKEIGGIDVGLAVGSVGIFEGHAHRRTLSFIVGAKEPFATFSSFVSAIHRVGCLNCSSFTLCSGSCPERGQHLICSASRGGEREYQPGMTVDSIQMEES